MYENSIPQPSRLPIVIAFVFALTTLVTGILAITGYSAANRERKTVDAQVAGAVAEARKDQQAKDAEEFRLISQSPFRSYTAPAAAGAFEIRFPKSWSAHVSEASSGREQIILTLGEDNVRVVNGKPDLAPAKVILRRQPLEGILREFNEPLKRKVMKLEEVKVSNLQAKLLTGTFSDKRTVRMVLVPVRDKTLIFSIEDKRFMKEFEQILAQSKVNP